MSSREAVFSGTGARVVPKILLYSLLVVNCTQYSVLAFRPDIYGLLRMITVALFVLLVFAISFKRVLGSILHCRTIRIFALCTLLFFTCSLVVLVVGADMSFSLHRDLLITLCALLCGYNINLSEKELDLYVKLYVVLGSIAAFSLLARYDFTVPESYLEIRGLYKNQIGILYGVLSLACAALLFMRRKSSLLVVCLALLVAVNTVIRARNALLFSLILLVVFIIFNRNLSVILRMLLVVLLACVIVVFRESFYVAFFSAKDVTDLNSLSSGRLARVVEGLSYLLDNFLSGSLWGDKYPGETIHVFVMNLLVDYGFLLSLPVLFIYFYLFVRSVRDVFRPRLSNILYIAPFCVFFVFLISLNEFSLPFSPSSSVCFAYILLGMYLKEVDANATA